MALFGRKSAGHDEPAANEATPSPGAGSTTPGLGAGAASVPVANQSVHATRGGATQMARIGKSIQLKGELRGDEDLEIDGAVDGSIELPSHTLIIAEHGRVTSSVSARCVRILGHLSGNVTASESVEVEASGVVEGDIRAPRLMIQEGAVLNGAVDMSSGDSSKDSQNTKASPKKDDAGALELKSRPSG